MLFTKREMSVQDLVAGELFVKENLIDVYGWPITSKLVEEQLHLDVVKEQMADDVEAELRPCSTDRFNGLIRLNEKYLDDENFEYLHEVLHYLVDVGVGQRVNKVYTRKRQGNNDDAHERRIDYLTAVTLVPGNELIKEIRYYRQHFLTIDETKFMIELQQKYKCTTECLNRRLKEVHAIRRAKRFPIGANV